MLTTSSSQFISKWVKKDFSNPENTSGLYNDLKCVKRIICDGSASLTNKEGVVANTLVSIVRLQNSESRLAIECLGALFARHSSKLSFSHARTSFICLREKLVELVQALKDGRSTHRWISTTFRALLCVLKAKRVFSFDDNHAHPDLESLTYFTDLLHYCLFTHASNPWLTALALKTPLPNHLNFSSDAPSESDTSCDVDLSIHARPRLDALRFLELIALQAGPHFLHHWDKFFGSPSLFQCMYNEPSANIRSAAGQCILVMLRGAQKVLENTPLLPSPSIPSEPRFTSLGGKLLHWLDYLHEACMSALRQDFRNTCNESLKFSNELIQSIKIIAVIAVSFKYELRPQKSYEVLDVLITISTQSTDSIISNECFHSLFTLHEAGCSLNGFTSILIPLIKKNIHLSSSWLLLSSLCSLDTAPTLTEYLPLLFTLAMQKSSDPNVIEAQCKFIERTISFFPDTFLSRENPIFMDQWMVPRLQGKDEFLSCEIACSCTCIASFSSSHFEKLESKRQIFFMTALLHHASSSDALIKGAACRALGVLSNFSCLHEDIQFLTDIKQALLEASEDPHLQVKSKVAWSLTQLLALYEKKILPLDHSVLLELLQRALELTQEPDVCKVHALRLLAILYPASRECHREETVHTLILKNIHKGAFKTRWNACRTAESILSVQEIPSLVQGLIEVLDVKNFKILIHATKALKYGLANKAYVIRRLHTLAQQYEKDASVYKPELMKSIYLTVQSLSSENDEESITTLKLEIDKMCLGGEKND